MKVISSTKVVINEGSMVMKSPELEHLVKKTFIYCTVLGTVGLLAELEPSIFKSLKILQSNMRQSVGSVGDIPHAE